MVMKILIEIFSSNLCLDMRKHSFSKRTINQFNKLSHDCVNASNVNKNYG